MTQDPFLALDATRLAKALGVSKSTLLRWTYNGLLPNPRKIGGRVFWLADEVLAALKAAPVVYERPLPVEEALRLLEKGQVPPDADGQRDPRPKRGRPSKARLILAAAHQEAPA